MLLFLSEPIVKSHAARVLSKSSINRCWVVVIVNGRGLVRPEAFPRPLWFRNDAV